MLTTKGKIEGEFIFRVNPLTYHDSLSLIDDVLFYLLFEREIKIKYRISVVFNDEIG